MDISHKLGEALDNMIGFLSPAAGYKRQRYRIAAQILKGKGGSEKFRYDGASRSRRTAGWSASNASANEETRLGLDTLRARSRDLTRNSGWGAAPPDIHEGNMVGSGIMGEALATTKKNDSQYAFLVEEYLNTTECDADGRHNFYGLQALGCRELVEAGEVLVRRRFRRPSDNLPVPVQYQLLEADHLDTLKMERGNNGNVIIQGIEFDKLGRRVAYWLFPNHPGDGMNFRIQKSVRIPANEISHTFDTLRVGQARGIPWVAPCLLRHRDFGDGVDAQLLRFKIANLFVGFIHDIEAPDSRPADSTDEYEIDQMEPGMMETLPPGKDVVFNKPPGVDGFRDLSEITLQEIAKASRVTFEQLTGNLGNVNFHSGRMGWIEFSNRNSLHQRKTFIPQFCAPLWKWMAEAGVATGRLQAVLPAQWTPPRRHMVDPVKETAALKAQIRAGLNSLPNALRELGYDPDKLMKNAAMFWKIVDKEGLLLDSDLRADKGRGPLALPEPDKGADKDKK